MNIKKLVRYSFIVIALLVFVIFGINKIILYQFKENDIIKEDITTLLSTQENMNKLIKNLDRTLSVEELEKMKQDFFTYEKKFENRKDKLFSKKPTDILDFFLLEMNEQKVIKSNISKLIENEHQIETYFDTLFDIQSKKIEYQILFDKLYPQENNIRKTIEKKILLKNDFKLLNAFSDIKYYSKEVLFQHRDPQTFDKWRDKINLLIKNYSINELKEYLKVTNDIGSVVLKIEELKNEEINIIKKISLTISYSNDINETIKQEIEKLSLEFQNMVYTISSILFFVLIVFIIILAYKVNKNVSMSVDEIEQQVHNGLEEINKLNQEIADTQKEVVFTMGAIGESRSKETGNHVKRVAEYSKLLALLHGISDEEAEMLKQASPMHDIGKIAIPDAILNKPGRFDENERLIMNTHAHLGYDMLKHSNRDLLKTAAIVSYQHHEKWDGSGYPRGLKGEEIHIYGRITALADVFDALGSNRCYKKAWDDEKIFQLFMEEKGKHFDPALITIFFDNLSEFLKIRDTFKDN
jgi:response regulator RpfG family c-di-GMP phosphodiesterase/predicted transposase YbfD/YdcC